jgi:hypothetical protein
LKILEGIDDWKTRSKWWYNIKADNTEIEHDDVDCLYLAENWDQWRTVTKTVIEYEGPQKT